MAAALVLGACGSDEPAASDTVPVPDDDRDLIAPRPIQIVSTGDATMSSQRAGAAAESDAGEMTVSDRMITPWGPVEFVLVDDLPALPTDDIGYVYEAGATVSVEQVAALAAAFGVDGEPVHLDDGYSKLWRVGPEDGTAPSLWVYEDALQSWNYSAGYDPANDVALSCSIESVEDVAPDAGEDASSVPPAEPVERCDEPTPPEGVPTAEQAEAAARDLLVALGEDPGALQYEVYADEWFASVSAIGSTGAGAPDRNWGFGFGAGGALQHAGGQLAVPQQVGPYPLVDLDTALARLDEQQSWFRYGPATDGGVAEPAIDLIAPEADAAGGALPAPAAEPTSEPLPVDMPEGSVEPIDPMPMPEPIPTGDPVVVTLVGVEADLWWVWDADGAVWLLPAYRFIDSDGGWHTVPAVTDEFMIQVEPTVEPPAEPTVDPAPADPTVDPAPADPTVEPTPAEPTVDPAPADPTAERTVDPTPAEPTVEPDTFDTSVLEPFVGLTLAEFERELELLGATVRVVERDGESLAVTMDLQYNRVNVVVTTDDAGVETVTAIQSVG